MGNLAETRQGLRIVLEKVDDVSIGRTTLPVVPFARWQPSTGFMKLFNALNGHADSRESVDLRPSLMFSMNNNTPCTTPGIAHERAVSAYFTYNPTDQQVIIEWGTIDPTNREAKLHTYLSRMIDYSERVKQGMKLSSGHIARIVTAEEETYLALLDNLPLNDVRITADDPMGKMVNTLHFSGFIPIAADGSVRLPAF